MATESNARGRWLDIVANWGIVGIIRDTVAEKFAEKDEEIADLRAKLATAQDERLDALGNVEALQEEIVGLRAKLDLVKGQLDADDTRIYDLYMETRAKLKQAERRVRRLEGALQRILDEWDLDSDYFQALNYEAGRAALAPENVEGRDG